ncbi:hypothetical protein AB0M43_16985 [Longispora sp. NPDC051575]|uniref:hypothetical protein n=1 Tax=Longispora sp. NPDC051575 TaxID=3154943 RepID=UPI00342CDD66
MIIETSPRVAASGPTAPTRWHRPLLYVAVAMVVLALGAVVGLLVDDRRSVGVPLWLKPLKFMISIGLYTLTMSWLLSLQTRFRRTAWWMGTVVAVALAVEMMLIVTQIGIRGRQLHFNQTTPVDAMFTQVMAMTIYAMWAAALVITVLSMFQRLTDRSLTWAIRLGLVLMLIGLALGMLMIPPTAEQAALHAAGQHLDIVGGHSVGVPDGGPGIPGLTWSTRGGDLRIPHFVGMHALQLLPLLAFLLRRFPDRFRTRLVFVAAAGYAGLLALLTWQALNGEPLLRPGAWTLAGFAVLVVATGAGVTMARAGYDHARGRVLDRH